LKKIIFFILSSLALIFIFFYITKSINIQTKRTLERHFTVQEADSSYYYQYIGRKVEIKILKSIIYKGIIINVTNLEICKSVDNLGNCIDFKRYISIFLKQDKDIIMINSNKMEYIKIIE